MIYELRARLARLCACGSKELMALLVLSVGLVGMSRGWVVVSQVPGKFVLMEIVLGFKHVDYAVATEIRLICLEMLEVVTHAALH